MFSNTYITPNIIVIYILIISMWNTKEIPSTLTFYSIKFYYSTKITRFKIHEFVSTLISCDEYQLWFSDDSELFPFAEWIKKKSTLQPPPSPPPKRKKKKKKINSSISIYWLMIFKISQFRIHIELFPPHYCFHRASLIR